MTVLSTGYDRGEPVSRFLEENGLEVSVLQGGVDSAESTFPGSVLPELPSGCSLPPERVDAHVSLGRAGDDASPEGERHSSPELFWDEVLVLVEEEPGVESENRHLFVCELFPDLLPRVAVQALLLLRCEELEVIEEVLDRDFSLLRASRELIRGSDLEVRQPRVRGREVEGQRIQHANIRCAVAFCPSVFGADNWTSNRQAEVF